MDNHQCKVKDFQVRAAFLVLAGWLRNGFIEVQCAICGAVYQFNLTTGESKRVTKH